jgi:hypothetical protein
MSDDAIETARKLATTTLMGHGSVVGVGRSADAVVLFVDDRRRAEPIVKAWRQQQSVPVQIKEVGGFVAAAGRAR